MYIMTTEFKQVSQLENYSFNTELSTNLSFVFISAKSNDNNVVTFCHKTVKSRNHKCKIELKTNL